MPSKILEFHKNKFWPFVKKWCFPVGLIFFHLGRLCFWFRKLDLSTGFPPVNVDYVVYFARALRSHIFLSQSGRFWGYDPYQMAGYMSGLGHEAKTLIFPLVCHFLSPAVPIAFSMIIIEFVSFLLCPFIIFFAAKNFNYSNNQAWAAFGISILTFGFVDPLSSYSVLNSLFGFFIASHLMVFHSSLAFRFFQKPTFKMATYFFVSAFILLMFHPLTLAIALFPMAGFYFLNKKNYSLKTNIYFGLGSMAMVAANWFWIHPLLIYSDFHIRIGHLPSQGWLGVLSTLCPVNLTMTNTMRSSLQLAILAGGLTLLINSIQQKKYPNLIQAGTALFLFVAAYFGSYLPILQITHPRRFEFPFWLLVGFLCAQIIDATANRFKSIPIVIVLIFGLGFAQQSYSLIFKSSQKEGFDFNLEPDQKIFIKYLKDAGPFPGRLMLEVGEKFNPHFAELIPLETRQPLLGAGLPGVYLASRFSLFVGSYFEDDRVVRQKPRVFNQELKLIPPTQFMQYMNLYNVAAIAVYSATSDSYIRNVSREFAFQKKVGDYWVYLRKTPISWFVKGFGRLNMDYDKLTLTELSSGELIIKFHWFKTLASIPAVPMKPVYLMDDPVPFIQIDNSIGAKEIVIKNAGL